MFRSTLGRRRSPATNWDWLRARLVVPGALLATTGGGGKGWATRDLWLGGTSRRLAVTSGMNAAALLWFLDSAASVRVLCLVW